MLPEGGNRRRGAHRAPGKPMSEVDLRRIANPYDFANPVTNERLFVGRDEQLADVLYYLKQFQDTGRAIHVAFLGDRTSGKTSFLNITASEASKRGFCVVRINLDEGDVKSQLSFFRKFFHQIASQAFSAGAFGGRSGQSYQAYLDLISSYKTDKGPEFTPLTFALIVARALDAGKVDDCHVMGKNRVILEKLRNIFMNLYGYMLVFAGTKELFLLIDDVFAPLMRQFKKVELGAFKTNAANHGLR